MFIKTRYSFALIAMAALLLVTSVSAPASNVDGKIKSSAKKSYVFTTYLKGDAIKIQSKDGIVTLTGTVSEESHKSMAEETVVNLDGVKSVNNQLKVTATPASVRSDAWLAHRVRSMLSFHRSMSYPNPNVSVTDGKVTLRGKTSSEAERQLMTEYARDVSGVKDVDNQMVVKESPGRSQRTADKKVDDASITTQVRMSLLYHHGTDVYDTKVSTHKGIVTLRGTAKNQAEIDFATKRVSDIHGVKSVDNQMTVASTQSSNN